MNAVSLAIAATIETPFAVFDFDDGFSEYVMYLGPDWMHVTVERTEAGVGRVVTYWVAPTGEPSQPGVMVWPTMEDHHDSADAAGGPLRSS